MKRKVLAVMLAFALCLSGCSFSEKAENVTESTVTNEADVYNRQSGSVISLYMRPPSTFNPLLNDDESVDMVLRLVFEPLIVIDGEFKPSANIAESWYFSNEGKTITLKLKSGLKWHSGKSITSDDVIYSINTIRNSSDSSMYKNCVKYIDSAYAVDSTTVDIVFTRAFYGNIYALSFPLISSQMGNGQNVYEGNEDMSKLGNGSFDFGAYSASKSLELIKAESCVGKDAAADSINVVISKDEDTDLYYFTNGTTDCVYGSAADFLGKNMPPRAAEYVYDTSEYDFIGFNFNNSILNDKSVRKAVALSVPKDDILKTIYLSNAVLTDMPINPVSWLYEDDTAKYDYDLNAAKAMLDENGWVLSASEGVREKAFGDGVKELSLSILVNSENEQRRQIAKTVADKLMSIGFDIEIKEAEFSEYISLINSGSYDIMVGGWDLSYDNDLGVLFGNNGSNIINYNDSNMNEYLDAVYKAVGESNVKAAYSDLQKYIAEELPYVSIAFGKGKLYTGNDIDGGKAVLHSWVYSGAYAWNKR